jgi:hypothetical protein
VVYGKYVAKEPIDFNGVRAFQPGDPVPEDSVKEHGWDELVQAADEPLPEDTEDASSGKAATPPASTGSSSGKKASGSRGTSSGN